MGIAIEPFKLVNSVAQARARAKPLNENQDLWGRMWGQKNKINLRH
jgi:hypothetical protein